MSHLKQMMTPVFDGIETADKPVSNGVVTSVASRDRATVGEPPPLRAGIELDAHDTVIANQNGVCLGAARRRFDTLAPKSSLNATGTSSFAIPKGRWITLER